MPLPLAWCPDGRPDLGEAPQWRAGQLPESKYQSYRHDLLVASYHPGHRAKWTAHELCHGLVGSAWCADASPLFHALAAWAAEVLPVALWYFFDEAQLRRCDLHAGGGPLFGTLCAACEQAAEHGPRAADDSDDKWWADGQRFVREQLDAVRASAAAGQLLTRRYATLDLASDGLAYAAAHGARLDSQAFRHLAYFFPPSARSIDVFCTQIQALSDALCASDLTSIRTASGAQICAQDLAWRLLTVAADCEGEAAERLLELSRDLAAEPTGDELIKAAIRGYESLCDDWQLPEPAEVFAVGYPLPGGYGSSLAQMDAGLASALPATLAHLAPEIGAEFCSADRLQRRHLAQRFADWLAGRPETPPGVADLARFEAHIADPPAVDLNALTLTSAANDQPLTRGSGVRVLSSCFDLPAAADGAALAAGTHPNHWLFARGADGDLGLHEISPEAAALLTELDGGRGRATEAIGLDPDELAGLIGLGALRPVRYSLVC